MRRLAAAVSPSSTAATIASCWALEPRMSDEAARHVQGVDYERVDADYLQKRQLQRGAAGWVLLAGLGVAYVVSGDFAG